MLAAFLTTLKELIDVLQGITVTAAAIVGGWWALNRYRRERTAEAAIDITMEFRSSPHGEEYLVFCDVCLGNKGKTKVNAKAVREEGFAYNDGVEKLRHSAGLQVRKVLPWAAPGRRDLDWFENILQEPMLGAEEVNLLIEYEDPQHDNRPDFWMEPGEIYHLGTTLLLPAGSYLVKVTFIGDQGDDNFWSRICLVTVPTTSTISPRDNEQRISKPA